MELKNERGEYIPPKISLFGLVYPYNLLNTLSTDLYLEGVIDGYEHVEF